MKWSWNACDVDEAKRTRRPLARARVRALRNRIETIMFSLAKRGPLECRSFQRIIISREYTRHYRYSGFDEYCMETVRAARRCLTLANDRDIRQILILRNTRLSSLPRASSRTGYFTICYRKQKAYSFIGKYFAIERNSLQLDCQRF